MISIDCRTRGEKSNVGLVVLEWVSFIVYMHCVFNLKLCYFEIINTGQKYRVKNFSTLVWEFVFMLKYKHEVGHFHSSIQGGI